MMNFSRAQRAPGGLRRNPHTEGPHTGFLFGVRSRWRNMYRGPAYTFVVVVLILSGVMTVAFVILATWRLLK